MTDLRLAGHERPRISSVREARERQLPVVVMTADGTVDSAVEAMKVGASNYVPKPFSFDELVLVIRKELDSHRLREENRSLARSAWPPLRLHQHHRAKRQDAGRARDGRARRADELDGAARRRKRRRKRSDRCARHSRTFAARFRPVYQNQITAPRFRKILLESELLGYV